MRDMSLNLDGASLGFWVLTGLALAVLSWAGALLSSPWRQARRRARWRRTPLPSAWRAMLRADWPQWSRLPTDLQLQLAGHIQVLLAEKPFIGCDGLEVTERMRLLVAAQACLLQLNRRADYFPGLRQVLLYPAPFWVDRVVGGEAGVVHERHQALSGESWQQGQVILSWPDVLAGAADPEDGRNVVVHEFAHQLDQQEGPANGAPWMRGRRRRARWARVMGAEFAALQARLQRGEPGCLDAYAATDPAEFFAVACEHFFEQGECLASERPALYDLLSDYFRLKPVSWA